MTPSRPYLIRAIYEWIVDNDLTPHVVINTTILGVNVPKEHIENDRIVLNISPMAIDLLDISNHTIRFDARFSGRVVHISAPISAITAIYSKENGRGMMFGEDDDPFSGDDGNGGGGKGGGTPPRPPTGGGKPHLKVVK